MPDRTDHTSQTPAGDWLLAGADLDAVLDDGALIDALARGEAPPDPSDPLAVRVVAFLAEVRGGVR